MVVPSANLEAAGVVAAQTGSLQPDAEARTSLQVAHQQATSGQGCQAWREGSPRAGSVEGVCDLVALPTKKLPPSKSKSKRYRCDLCTGVFTRLGNYTRHRKIHTLNVKVRRHRGEEDMVAHIDSNTNSNTHTDTDSHMHMCMHTQTCMHTHPRTCTLTRAHTYTHTHIHIHTQTNTHTAQHTLTHTHTRIHHTHTHMYTLTHSPPHTQ